MVRALRDEIPVLALFYVYDEYKDGNSDVGRRRSTARENGPRRRRQRLNKDT